MYSRVRAQSCARPRLVRLDGCTADTRPHPRVHARVSAPVSAEFAALERHEDTRGILNSASAWLRYSWRIGSRETEVRGTSSLGVLFIRKRETEREAPMCLSSERNLKFMRFD
jgi:hypothetical protein